MYLIKVSTVLFTIPPFFFRCMQQHIPIVSQNVTINISTVFKKIIAQIKIDFTLNSFVTVCEFTDPGHRRFHHNRFQTHQLQIAMLLQVSSAPS